MVPKLTLIIWILQAGIQVFCGTGWKETRINFNRNYTGVVFDPFISSDDVFNFLAKTKQDLLPVIKKIHTNFDKVLVSVERVNGIEQNFVSLAFAKYNAHLRTVNKNNLEPIQVWLSDIMGRVSPEHLNERFKTIYGYAEEANKIFRGTVSTIMLDYTYSAPKNQSDITEDLIQARSVFPQTNYKIGAVLPINTDAIVDMNEFFFIAQIDQILPAADIVMFSMIPNSKYVEVSNGSHVNYFIQHFEQAKNVPDASLKIPVVFKTGWPDTSQDGYTSYKYLTDFWKGISEWAEKTKTLVIFERAFDTPYSQFDTYGWWRVSRGGSHENPGDYVFEDKTSKCDPVSIYQRNDSNLLHPKQFSFSKKNVVVNFDLSKVIDPRFINDPNELTNLFMQQPELVSKFQRLYLYSRGDRDEAWAYHRLELHTKSLATVNKKMAEKKGLAEPLEIMISFGGSNVEEGIQNFDKIKTYVEDANNLFPGTVKTFLLEGYYGERDAEILQHARSTNSEFILGRIYALHVCMSLVVERTDDENILHRIIASSDVKVLVFIFPVADHWMRLGWERAHDRATAMFDSCKRRISLISRDVEVVFYTSWSDKDRNGVVNYAQMVNYWEAVGAWAAGTNTTVIFDGAFEGDDHNSCGWWLLKSNKSEFLYKLEFEEKKSVVLKMNPTPEKLPRSGASGNLAILEEVGILIGMAVVLFK